MRIVIDDNKCDYIKQFVVSFENEVFNRIMRTENAFFCLIFRNYCYSDDNGIIEQNLLFNFRCFSKVLASKQIY
jgi:hypothetical protein